MFFDSWDQFHQRNPEVITEIRSLTGATVAGHDGNFVYLDGEDEPCYSLAFEDDGDMEVVYVRGLNDGWPDFVVRPFGTHRRFYPLNRGEAI